METKIPDDPILWDVDSPTAPLKPSQGRNYVRTTLARNLPKIMTRFLNDASGRTVTQLKLITELLESPAKPPRKGKGTIEMLLEEFGSEEIVNR